ncbi:hypothetical protein HDU99_006286 [Rhizoclosmatium hyalinum]|nr:hypothetical protein HDU99_006286 [Rhizoclosmatium hyalinum]
MSYKEWLADGWIPVWVGMTVKDEVDDTWSTDNSNSVMVKMAKDRERKFMSVTPKLTPPKTAVKLHKHTAKLCRIATVQGICPFTVPGYGIGKTIKKPSYLHIAGLDIEQTIVNSDGFRACRFTPGYVNQEKLQQSGNPDIHKCNTSREMVDWAIEWMLTNSPDFVCIHNGFGYDISRLAAHCSPKYGSLFVKVNLGKVSKGLDMCIPGVTIVDTWWFLQKLHGADYESTNLASLAKHYGIADKTKSPPMSIDVNDPNYDYTDMALYNIHDAYIGVEIGIRSKCIDEIISLSVITKSPLSDASRFISGTLMTNLATTHALSMNKIMDWSPEPLSAGKYKGAMVLTPVRGVHSDVHVFDFKSLYPNIMVSCNISTETVLVLDCDNEDVRTQVLDKLGMSTDEAVFWNDDYIQLTLDGKLIALDRKMRSVQATSLVYLIDERARIKKTNEGKDTPLSYGMKISANSAYGALGTSTGAMSSRYAAASVTAIGRWLLSLAITIARKIGALPLYGDTDSIFLVSRTGMNGDEHTLSIHKELPNTFMTIFHCILSHTPFTTIKFEHEKTYTRLLLVNQKNYVGYQSKYDKKTQMLREVQDIKGIAAKRRDRIMIAREVSAKVAHIICHNDTNDTLKVLAEYLMSIFIRIDRGNITLQETSLERKEDGIQYYVYMGANGNIVKIPIDMANDTETQDINRRHVADCVLKAISPIFSACNLPTPLSLCEWYLNVNGLS